MGVGKKRTCSLPRGFGGCFFVCLFLNTWYRYLVRSPVSIQASKKNEKVLDKSHLFQTDIIDLCFPIVTLKNEQHIILFVEDTDFS